MAQAWSHDGVPDRVNDVFQCIRHGRESSMQSDTRTILNRRPSRRSRKRQVCRSQFCGTCRISGRPGSGIEPEMHDIAVLHGVFLALEPKLAGVARSGFAPECDVIGISDGLRADEALLEVRVDDARRLRGPRAAGDRPGAGFLGADREVGDEAEEFIARPDHAVEAWLLEADRFEVLALLGGREHGDLALDLRGDYNGLRALLPSASENRVGIGVALVRGRLLDVANVENRLRGEKAEHAEGALLLGLALDEAGRLALP